jgi:hypothetical protein
MNEPAGGETRQEHEANKPKKGRSVVEAMRPSHVFGGEKNAPAPDDPITGTGTSLRGESLGQVEGSGMQEGLRRSGKGSAGIGGLEGGGASGSG